jgi:hypothetical protein
LYVDPATDVILYHNFETGQRVFEHMMTDEILEEVNVANYYGEALEIAKVTAKKMKKDDYDRRVKHYYTKRIQYMYRYWKAKKERSEVLWKVDTTIAREQRVYQKKVIEFAERLFKANKQRKTFRRQYLLTMEKVWDAQEKRMFWYNHHTKESHWDQPKLVRRYGDTEVPVPWIVSKRQDWQERRDLDANGEKQYDSVWVTSYWHATSGVELLRKPDGVFICEVCHTSLALRYCNECHQKQCFGCHRELHSHPWGWLQNVRLTKKMKLDPTFAYGMEMVTHSWRQVEPIRCGMCKSSKIMAAFACNECRKPFCRPCHRRIHESGEHQHHTHEVI